MNTTNPAPSEYERRELNRQLHAIETAPLRDRKEAAAEWLDALKNSPATIPERVEWMIEGNYGYAIYVQARDNIQNKRMNHTAWLGIMIAALEWQCPNPMARAMWNKLTTAEQETITTALNSVIEAKLAEMQEESAE